MGFVSAYNLARLTEDDARIVAKKKRDEAQAKLEAARVEFDEWDRAYSNLLSKWADKYHSDAKAARRMLRDDK